MIVLLLFCVHFVTWQSGLAYLCRIPPKVHELQTKTRLFEHLARKHLFLFSACNLLRFEAVCLLLSTYIYIYIYMPIQCFERIVWLAVFLLRRFLMRFLIVVSLSPFCFYGLLLSVAKFAVLLPETVLKLHFAVFDHAPALKLFLELVFCLCVAVLLRYTVFTAFTVVYCSEIILFTVLFWPCMYYTCWRDLQVLTPTLLLCDKKKG